MRRLASIWRYEVGRSRGTLWFVFIHRPRAERIGFANTSSVLRLRWTTTFEYQKRRYFIGGSDARIIIGDDEGGNRSWRPRQALEKRGVAKRPVGSGIGKQFAIFCCT